MGERQNRKLNNDGFSLVELLVALSVGMIVAGMIGGLLAFSSRTYNNESVNVAMQYEIQTNLNQLTDAIVSSQGLVLYNSNIGADDERTEYLGLMYLNKEHDADASKPAYEILVFTPGTVDESGKFSIYMERTYNNEFTDTVVSDIADGIKDEEHLLGENATGFKVTWKQELNKDKDGNPVKDSDGNDTYENPLVIDVSLDFEKKASRKDPISKHVDDEVYMRNQVETDIYVNGIKYTNPD